MDGLLEPWQTLKYEVCFDFCALCVLNQLKSTANSMKMGIYGVWLSTVAGQTWASSMSTTDDAWCTDMFSCWHCQRARHSLGAKESHGWWRRLYGTVWAFLVFIGHVTLIRESSFGAETWLITQNLKLEKGCMIEKLSSSSSKANESVISKDDHGKLSGDHKHVLVLYFLHHGDSLLIVIVVHLPNCACFLQKVSVTLPKYWPFAWKCQASHTQVDSCLWLYIWDVMDQSHSCTHCFISHWILEKHLIAIDGDYRHLTTLFTLEYKPWYHCGANAKMIVVTMLRSGAYHLLHVCHVLIKVTIIFRHKCLLPYFVKVLCIYIAV